MDEFMAATLAQARESLERGGYPIGSVLVNEGRILGRGRNTLWQDGDPTGHAEMEAFRDAAQLVANDGPPDRIAERWRGGTIYTTMMPCAMCAGAIIRFRIARVVVAETETYPDFGARPLMERQGIEVEVLGLAESMELVRAFETRFPERARNFASGGPTLRL